MSAPRPFWPVLVTLVAALGVALLAGLLYGAAPGVSAGDVLRVLVALPPADADASLVELLLFEVRFPRVLLLALTGAAMAACGATLQSVLQNPLAAPGVLGVSAGASVGAVFAYVSGAYLAWRWSLPVLAFAGALAALLLVWAIARASGRQGLLTLVLTGVAVSSLGSALVSLMLIRAGGHRVHEIFAWLLGSADSRTWEHVFFALPPVLVGLAALLLCNRLIDALALGEEHALSIGVDVPRARLLLLTIVALAAGGAVSVVGPIAFVGLMVPHLLRAAVGAAAKRLLPATILGGAAFLVLADVLARSLSTTSEVPVGVITSLAGVAFFLALIKRLR